LQSIAKVKVVLFLAYPPMPNGTPCKAWNSFSTI
jgi:hypothetical protein